MANTYKSVSINLPATNTSGDSGGSTPPASGVVFEQTFTSGDFSVSGSDLVYTVTTATHSQGTEPMVQIEELSGSNYVAVDALYEKNSLGDITIRVGTGSNFSGRILIKG